jgi:hypothetical protein
MALAALCLGLCVAGLVTEGLVLLTFGEQVKFPRRVVGAPWGLRYNEPGVSYRHKSPDGAWQFRINGQGMRADRDFSYEKPAGVRRVVVVGDSFAVGYEVDSEQTFAMVLERELKKKNPNVEVLNAGVSGYSTAEAALYIERELIKYQPDVVVSSFYENDFLDNVRAGLFRLDGATLVAAADSYVPAGRLGNFLNTNVVFNLLSERSNSFAFAKERLTLIVKGVMDSQNQSLEQAPGAEAAAPTPDRRVQEEYERRLLAAIVNRMYAFLHERNIPLVILSIPQIPKTTALVSRFPHDLVDVTRPGFEYVAGERILRQHVGRHLLYNRFSLNHWTPIAHETAGKAIADLSLWDQLLQ